MKNLLLSSLLSLAILPITAQVATPMPGQLPVITPANVMNPEYVQFRVTEYDFGNIKQNEPVSYTFEFKNVGKRDITIVNVSASCGCTTPNWKGGIYRPDSTGKVTATFNAASEGFFNKIVTVTTSEGVINLVIKGTVLNEAAYKDWRVIKDAEDAAAKAAKEEADKKNKKGKKAKKEKKAKKAKKEKKAKKADAEIPKESEKK